MLRVFEGKQNLITQLVWYNVLQRIANKRLCLSLFIPFIYEHDLATPPFHFTCLGSGNGREKV